MRIIVALLLFAVIYANRVAASNEPDFKHHTFELSITPCFDYHFITSPKRWPGFKQQIDNLYRPFIGFNFGLTYIYRPIRYIGISAGFSNVEYGIGMGKIVGTFASPNSHTGFVNAVLHFKGYIFRGYIGVPILIHGCYQINRIGLDLATGPEILFPIFTSEKYSSTSDSVGAFYTNVDRFRTVGAGDMLKYSWLGWDIQLSANIPLKKCLELSVGPEIKFLTVYPLQHGPYYQSVSHEIDFYTGIKVGFRLGSDFYSIRTKASKTR